MTFENVIFDFFHSYMNFEILQWVKIFKFKRESRIVARGTCSCINLHACNKIIYNFLRLLINIEKGNLTLI